MTTKGDSDPDVCSPAELKDTSTRVCTQSWNFAPGIGGLSGHGRRVGSPGFCCGSHPSYWEVGGSLFRAEQEGMATKLDSVCRGRLRRSIRSCQAPLGCGSPVTERSHVSSRALEHHEPVAQQRPGRSNLNGRPLDQTTDPTDFRGVRRPPNKHSKRTVENLMEPWIAGQEVTITGPQNPFHLRW